MENKQHLNTPLVTGSMAGLIIGVFAGPVAAVIGVILGASAGFWYNKKELSHHANTGRAQKKSSQAKVLHD